MGERDALPTSILIFVVGVLVFIIGLIVTPRNGLTPEALRNIGAGIAGGMLTFTRNLSRCCSSGRSRQ